MKDTRRRYGEEGGDGGKSNVLGRCLVWKVWTGGKRGRGAAVRWRRETARAACDCVGGRCRREVTSLAIDGAQRCGDGTGSEDCSVVLQSGGGRRTCAYTATSEYSIDRRMATMFDGSIFVWAEGVGGVRRVMGNGTTMGWGGGRCLRRRGAKLLEVHHLLHEGQGAAIVHLDDHPNGVSKEVSLRRGHTPFGGVQSLLAWSHHLHGDVQACSRR